MPRIIATVVVAAVIGVTLVGVSMNGRAEAHPTLGTAPVLVELFTSQGCSSCPPADALLRKIANDPKLRGKVIPLSFHVDYWNSLGWRDPFSERAWTERQGSYVRAMRLSGAYTPQVVVAGAREMVGSNERNVFAAIEEQSKRAIAGRVTIERKGETIAIRAESPRANVDVVLVAFEEEVTTRVERGENAGRTITNSAIVRELRVLGSVPLSTKAKVSAKYGVVVFLQERETRKIDAVAEDQRHMKAAASRRSPYATASLRP